MARWLVAGLVWFQLLLPTPPATAAPKYCGDPARVLIVLDRSGSMSSYNKWTDAKNAVNGLINKYSGQIYFGLMLFPGPGGSCTPGVVDVAVSATSKGAISTTMNKNSPTGMTPMGATMKNAHSYLKGFLAKQSKYVLLITDGSETCSGRAIDWVKALMGLGIKTFVVGFGSGVNATELNNLANAGGTPLPGTTRYYRADNPTQLSAALQTIGKAVSCCGNGKLDPGERCEKTLAWGTPGACPRLPSHCPYRKCFLAAPTGTECNVVCGYKPVTQPKTGDGCCPPGANHNNDKDCPANCGNGVLEAGEQCDPGIKAGPGRCKTLAACDDGNACTKDEVVGGACHRQCRNTRLVAIDTRKDGCCPPHTTSMDDPDCPPPCGPDRQKNCLDPCKTVTCPPNFYCYYGKCLQKKQGSGADGGASLPGTDGGSPGQTGSGFGPQGTISGTGCACQTGGGSGGMSLLLALLLLGLWGSHRRRR
jgi:MYXO-CTERM domain-containing protein